MRSGENIFQVKSPAGVVHVGSIREMPLSAVRQGLCYGRDLNLWCWRSRDGEMIHDMLADEVYGNLVVWTSRNDHIGKFLGWNAKLFKGWLDKLNVLVQNLVHITSKLVNILQNSLGQSGVGISVDEELHVEHVSHFRRVECQNTLEENHVHLARFDGSKVVHHPGVGLEVVHRDSRVFPIDNVLQTGEHQLVIESVRMIKVEKSLSSLRLLCPSEFPVERVLREVDDLSLNVLLVQSQLLHYLFTDSRLS